MPEHLEVGVGAFRAMDQTGKALGDHVWWGDTFCHYTDLCGLKGILENSEIWLSDHRFLNDSSEHSYGEQLTIDVIKEEITKNKNNKFILVLEETLKLIIGRVPVFYIASMSTAIDRLDQWKAYGRSNEGVCLVFNSDIGLGRDGVLVSLPAIEPIKVIYDREEQVRRIKIILAAFYVEISSANCTTSDIFSLWQKNLAGALGLLFIRYKNPEYESEEEIRLVVSATSPILSDKPSHRVSGGRIIPFMTNKNRSLSANRLPIKEIIVCPIATQDSIIKSIEVFLENIGYKDIPVRRSSLPFRG